MKTGLGHHRTAVKFPMSSGHHYVWEDVDVISCVSIDHEIAQPGITKINVLNGNIPDLRKCFSIKGFCGRMRWFFSRIKITCVGSLW